MESPPNLKPARKNPREEYDSYMKKGDILFVDTLPILIADFFNGKIIENTLFYFFNPDTGEEISIDEVCKNSSFTIEKSLTYYSQIDIEQAKFFEKQSINYRIQNRGAMCSKYAGILLFKWIVKNHLQNIVKICIPVHDKIFVVIKLC